MIEAMKQALGALGEIEWSNNSQWQSDRAKVAITSLRQAIADLEKKKPVAWKLVPIEPTEEMLKAMDECSTEGYDERLYSGHAASVYMAAVDVAPSPPAQQEPVAWRNVIPGGRITDKWESARIADYNQGWNDYRKAAKTALENLYTSPPQRQWKELTDEEIFVELERVDPHAKRLPAGLKIFAHYLEAKLRSKNT
jgi:hypothetical protein